MATLEVRSLSRDYPGEVVALTEASFTVRDGRICAILGPSGCGKTTLLRLIAGLDDPDAGDVLLDDLSILDQPPHRRGIGLMFQDLALFPHMTVRENIAFGLRMVGWPRAEREQRVADLLDVVGLTRLGNRRIDALSGGEQQRVALARTLAPQPTVILLDEPLGAIDEVMKNSLRLELRSILNALETTAIIVSHDLRDAIAMADDLVVMGEGRVLQTGPIGSVLGEPATTEVAELAGYLTVAHGTVRRGRVEEFGVGAMAVEGLDDGEVVRVMAHPASLLAVPADSGLGSGIAGLVVQARAQGPTWLVDLSLGDRIVETRWEWDLVPPRKGARLAISARPGTLRVFTTTPDDLPSAAPPIAPAIASVTAPLVAPPEVPPVAPPVEALEAPPAEPAEAPHEVRTTESPAAAKPSLEPPPSATPPLVPRTHARDRDRTSAPAVTSAAEHHAGMPLH